MSHSELPSDDFKRALARLAATFGKTLDAALLRAYWLALSDVPPEALESAVDEACKHARMFPRPANLREILDTRPSLRPERPAESGAEACAECHDSGFVLLTCTDRFPCERCRRSGRLTLPVVRRDDRGRPLPVMASVAYDHDYARICSCRPTNPNFQFQLAARRHYHREQEHA